jgi:hypothetical protein
MWDADAIEIAIDDAAFSSGRRAIDDQGRVTGEPWLFLVR